MDAAVEQERHAIIATAADGNDVRRIVTRRVLHSTADRCARQRDELRHLPAVQRQLHHAHVVHDLADAGAARLHERSVSLNFDGFRNLADLE